MKNLQELQAAHRSAQTTLAIFSGSIRRLRPDTVDSDAKQHFDQLANGSEPIRRLPQAERARIQVDIQRETLEVRRLAAAIARHHVLPFRQLAADAQAFAEYRRRNTELSFPAALDHVSPDGMINLALLRLQLMPVLAGLSPAELYATYAAAHERKDPLGLVEASLIEQMVTRPGAALAKTEADVPILRELVDYVEGVQRLRVPEELPDFDSLSREADKLNVLADVIQVHPVPPEQNANAAAAFDGEQAANLEAGQKNFDDDLREFQERVAR